MSADHWGGCPRCYEQGEFEQQQRFDALAGAYGVMPEVTFFELKRAINDYEPIDLADEGEFREDYEFYIQDGAVHACFHGQCQTCGFTVQFHYIHPFETGFKAP